MSADVNKRSACKHEDAKTIAWSVAQHDCARKNFESGGCFYLLSPRNNGRTRNCYATPSKVNVKSRSRNMMIESERTVIGEWIRMVGRSPARLSSSDPNAVECRKCRMAQVINNKRPKNRTIGQKEKLYFFFFLFTHGFHIHPCATNPPWSVLRDFDYYLLLKGIKTRT